jgi:drug/metabolite transporter (DMT)-like permease
MGLLSTTSVLGNLYPVVTVVLAAVVLRERLRPVQYIGVAASLAGVLVLAAVG